MVPSFCVALQIIKFVGCYHGHADSFLVQAGSGVATLGLPDCPGVPQGSTGKPRSPPTPPSDNCRRTVVPVYLSEVHWQYYVPNSKWHGQLQDGGLLHKLFQFCPAYTAGSQVAKLVMSSGCGLPSS